MTLDITVMFCETVRLCRWY